MTEFVGYQNGEWMPMSQIGYVVGDLGPGKGDQVVEVVRTFDGKSFRMKDHIDRMYKSLKYVRIDLDMTPHEMIDLSEEGIERNRHLLEASGDFSITQLVTRGSGGPRAWAAGPPNVYIKYGPAATAWYADMYTDGAHGVITRTRSYEPEALDAKVKHLSRMNMSMAELEANDVDPGAWPILTDKDGHLTEGSGYNFFVVTDGVVRSPTDRAILAGISRAMVFDLARQLGIPATEENLQPYDAYTADEAFFTSTPFSLLPVTYIDKRPVNDGKPGPISQQLLAAWSEAVGVDIVDQAMKLGTLG
jgi:branched-chain amino acid aminotransferase